MPVTQNAKKYHEKMFPGYESDFLRTDPEFIDRLSEEFECASAATMTCPRP